MAVIVVNCFKLTVSVKRITASFSSKLKGLSEYVLLILHEIETFVHNNYFPQLQSMIDLPELSFIK